MAYEQKAGEGAMPGDRGDAKAQPSGSSGDNPATAGRGETKVTSETPDRAENRLNPSAPGETGTTPRSNARRSKAAERDTV